MQIRRGRLASKGVRGPLTVVCAPLFGVVVMLAGLGFILVPSTPAAAAPPVQGWTTTQAPLPTDAGNGSTNPNVYLASSACPAANNCTMVGWYYDTSDWAWGLIEQQSGTNWTQTEAPEPADHGTGSNQGLWIGSHACGYDQPCRALSCPTPTFCIAVGDYYDTGKHYQPVVETESNGTWTAATGPLPSDAATDLGPTFPAALLFSVSCTSTTSCVAVGQYRTTSDQYAGLIATLSGTTWSAIAAPLPEGVTPTNTGFPPVVTGVSCISATICTAVGTYYDGLGKMHGLLEMLSNGSWIAATAPEPGDAGTGSLQSALLSQVDCPTASACTAVGFYRNTAGNSAGLIESWNGTTWTATTAPAPAGNLSAQLGAVSCPTPNFCVTVGQYEDSNSRNWGLLDTLSGGTWTGGAAPEPTAVPESGQYAFLWEVNCPTPAFCLVAGEYDNASSNTTATVITYSAGSWSAAAAPVPSNVTNYFRGPHGGLQLTGRLCLGRAVQRPDRPGLPRHLDRRPGVLARCD